MILGPLKKLWSSDDAKAWKRGNKYFEDRRYFESNPDALQAKKSSNQRTSAIHRQLMIDMGCSNMTEYYDAVGWVASAEHARTWTGGSFPERVALRQKLRKVTSTSEIDF